MTVGLPDTPMMSAVAADLMNQIQASNNTYESAIQTLMSKGLTADQASEVFSNLVTKGGYTPDQVADLIASPDFDANAWTDSAIAANDGKPPFTKANDDNPMT